LGEILDLKELRKKIQTIVLGTNNIDRLMTNKVNDYILIEEQPLPITIGDRTIFIGNFTLDNNFKFWEMYGKILMHIGMKFINFELIGDMQELYKAIHVHKKLHKELVKLIGKTILKQQAYYLTNDKVRKELSWKNCSYRYFKKWITVEKLLQICKLVHLYNFDAEKKNLKILLGSLDMDENQRQCLEIFGYSWFQNLSGLTGRFQLSLLTNVDYWSDEAQRETVGISKDGKKVKEPVNG